MRISVEGLIGCGKSTALRALRDALPCRVLPEPVHEWSPLLDLFYQDRRRWGFALNARVLVSYSRHRAQASGDLLSERSPYSCRHVFGQVLYNEGSLTDKEWQLFRRLHDALAWQPDVLVYIRTPPGLCMDRILRRARPAEAGLTVAYLRKLHFQQTAMITYFPGRVHVVDGSADPDIVAQRIAEILGAYLTHAPPAGGRGQPAR